MSFVNHNHRPKQSGESMVSSLLGRRDFLRRLGGGFGSIALAHLLGENSLFAATETSKPRADLNGGLHHRAKVKRVIQLFMNGGASQIDTFDYKPRLIKLSGGKFDPGARVEAVTSSPGNLMKSPWDWKQHGQSGRWVSSVFPHIATCVDDLAFLMAMTTKSNAHGPANYMQNTGFLTPGFPCMGSWVSYGLGNLTENLPAFVVLPDSRGLPYNGTGSFSSGFLPVSTQGTVIKTSAPEPIFDLFLPPMAKSITQDGEKKGLALLNKMNRDHLAQNPGDSRLDARIAAYELAAKMQLSAPAVLDTSGETEATRKLYGLDKKETEDFGRNCLVGRRLLEKGVRFVQVWSGPYGMHNNWDNHENIGRELGSIAMSTDQPVAGLIKDLKARGMFEDTLVIWTTEFGRMPFTQGDLGRDHNGGTFVSWLAGAGIKGGVAYGSSDEWSWKAVENPTYCYDLHATVLHLLGINHEKLVFRNGGTDRRLTDVHGHVIQEILT
ncbi:MAG: hypothetical protein JWQ71_150 [Pedosphaera sp.]|nr:hypothetical protein [Pedosphaera sp.]